MQIVILTHGGLAAEFERTLKLFIETEHIKTLTLNPSDNLDAFKNNIESVLFSSSAKDILVLVDLFGGTPFNTVVKLCKENKDKDKNIEILTGVNLPMILEASLNMESKSLEEVKTIALEAGKASIRDLYSELKERSVLKE